jgi:3-hydroxyisobutyrate dehydrogenase
LKKEMLMTTSSNADTKIAFLGLGQMGSPMATRLVGAGFDVRVWNRSPQALGPLVDAGAKAASSPAEASRDVDFVVTMLPEGATVLEVMSGPEGVLATLSSGATWLQMSSIGVEWTTRLIEIATHHDVVYIDAPVSGSIGPAKDGTLIVLASGPAASKAVVAPVFATLGKDTVWLGDAGAGSKAKLVLNNWLVDLVESTVETLHFSQALGVDPHAIIDLLDEAPIGSPYAVAKARLMLEGDFTPNFALKHAFKDAKLSLEAAKSAKTELRITESLIDAWQRAVASGLGDEDLSAVYLN